MRLAAAMAGLAFSVAAGPIATGQPLGGAQPEAAFSVRNGHSVAYDAEGRRMLLFGGADEAQVLGDTRAWHAPTRSWRLVTTSGPGRRTFAAMAYDDARRETVLFGGNRVLFGSPDRPPAFLNDTWVLRGNTWIERRVDGPAPRAEAALAYDARRRRIVLFGGYRAGSTSERFGDTWEWDGAQWQHAASTGPSARNGAAMAYDAGRGRVILFGGRGASNETWEWDGRAWTRLGLLDVPGRYNATLTYDSARRQLVRFGGWTGSTRTSDTWLFDMEWREVIIDGPSARNHAAMAFDRRRRVAILVAGHDGERVFGDTWEWNGIRWTQVAGVPPRTRIANGH